MSAEKLNSVEVPQKFLEWLLTMGYPVEKALSIDKITQKCRGQYYMVWRSLMEHVKPKHEIQEKRLKVFCDDVAQCQKINVFNERNSSVVVPEQLLLWREQAKVHRKLASAENRVKLARDNLNQLMDKISSRISQRDIYRRQVEDKQRRVGLLRQVAADLELKMGKLKETKDIAHSLCDTTHKEDLLGKVDKCLSLIQRGGGPPRQPNALNPMASSSVVSFQGDDTEEQLASLARCPGSALWTQLCAKRAAIHSTLAHANTLHYMTNNNKNYRTSTQAVLAHTASLHSTLALGAMKNQALVDKTRARFVACIEDINDYISSEMCELLVLCCERASTEARVNSLRTLLDDLNSNSGVFEVAHESSEPVNGRQISAIDKSIVTSRDELKRLTMSLAATERKIYSIKQALKVVFDSFYSQVPADIYRVFQLTFSQDSIATVCQFYSEKREERRNKADLSMDFDASDCFFDNTTDPSNLRYIDELRIYLKKFCLEKNQKLILESGQKLWIFETLQSSLERLYSRWLSSDVTPLLCPSASLSMNLTRIVTEKQMKSVLKNIVKQLECNGKYLFDIDLTTEKEQEDAAIDKVKKQIGENLLSLKKSTKMLELGQNNLHLWQDDVLKKYISNNRTVDGKTYREYEAFYIESLTLNA